MEQPTAQKKKNPQNPLFDSGDISFDASYQRTRQNRPQIKNTGHANPQSHPLSGMPLKRAGMRCSPK